MEKMYKKKTVTKTFHVEKGVTAFNQPRNFSFYV